MLASDKTIYLSSFSHQSQSFGWKGGVIQNFSDYHLLISRYNMWLNRPRYGADVLPPCMQDDKVLPYDTDIIITNIVSKGPSEKLFRQ